jgi:hypothetical protein
MGNIMKFLRSSKVELAIGIICMLIGIYLLYILIPSTQVQLCATSVYVPYSFYNALTPFVVLLIVMSAIWIVMTVTAQSYERD